MFKCSNVSSPRDCICQDSFSLYLLMNTAWRVSKYGVFSSPYFPVFISKAGKYGPEKTPYLDTFHTLEE